MRVGRIVLHLVDVAHQEATGIDQFQDTDAPLIVSAVFSNLSLS